MHACMHEMSELVVFFVIHVRIDGIKTLALCKVCGSYIPIRVLETLGVV